ncbi:helix-turn-helix domain-containing protein [Elizabethkingia anophelis]|uniref:excisionase family DNA-binding protein n=1 Tax=Elizabethkingia TaxID=308865 RepID=UPI00293CCD3D|nr:helix-turn-helix domain-containing protein [Elizabethkingia anophelis]MCT3676938.1 helix-turn-helix domain-containing protein [Elizabethkingia anophelis]MCT3684373.1 helix-turn-helix domain-containing protein [Elizabethkingia anophelis]MCT4001754.1 helix-turn-helix domain-containing protein [Elizabethkingia anophelis]MCT4015677.1 helix-turn-helix domain-containing protein [Elizabethkingia anophelis]
MSSNIRINRVCNYCNQKFVAKTFTTKYCSHKCNQRDYKKRIKEEKLLKSKEEYSIDSKISKLKKVTPTFDIELLKSKSYLSISEVCVLMNMCDSTVRKLIKEERIKTIRLGKKHIIPKSQLDNLVN